MSESCWSSPYELDQPLPRPYRSTPEWRTAIQLGFWMIGLPIFIVGAAAVALLSDGEHKSDWAFYGQAMLLGVLIGVLIAALYFAFISLIYRKERYLVRWGTVAPAKIVSEDESRSRYGTSTRLVYQFRDRDGGFEENSRGGLPAMSLFQPGLIDPLMITIRLNPTVLYDPLDASRSLLYPPKYVECFRPTAEN